MKSTEKNIFISHRSTDVLFAKLLVDFLTFVGVPNNNIFCSSLPGNDVQSKINEEIKQKLQNSSVNIIIFSRDYYESAYCLNEAGVIWYVDKPTIIFGLPEILPENLFGFIDKNYILRRLNCKTDLMSIFEQVDEVFNLNISIVKISERVDQLINDYNDIITSRGEKQLFNSKLNNGLVNETEITDDEAAVLYYIWKCEQRKIDSPTQVTQWFYKNEIYDINAQNAFDLLSQSKYGIINNNSFELNIDTFRYYIKRTSQEMKTIIDRVFTHYKSSVQTIKDLWNNGSLNDYDKLFFAYIVDEKVYSFEDRWNIKNQVNHIVKWECKHSLYNILSCNYDSCIQLLIENKLVYPSLYTKSGIVYEYSLYDEMKKFLFDKDLPFTVELNELKNKYYLNIPF